MIVFDTQDELEQLNEASAEINKLELQLDVSRLHTHNDTLYRTALHVYNYINEYVCA